MQQAPHTQLPGVVRYSGSRPDVHRFKCSAAVFGVKADSIDDREGTRRGGNDRPFIVHVGTDECDGRVLVFDGGLWPGMPRCGPYGKLVVEQMPDDAPTEEPGGTENHDRARVCQGRPIPKASIRAAAVRRPERRQQWGGRRLRALDPAARRRDEARPQRIANLSLTAHSQAGAAMTHRAIASVTRHGVKGNRAGVRGQPRHWRLSGQRALYGVGRNCRFHKATARAPLLAAARPRALRRGKQVIGSGREAGRWVGRLYPDGRVTNADPDRRQHIHVCYPALAEADPDGH